MDERVLDIVDTLQREHGLPLQDYALLLEAYSPEVAAELAARAVDARKAVYGTAVFMRGLLEFTNVCRNNCRYCGLRSANATCRRYRLQEDEIVACADRAYDLGFRTVVLQGGEDPWLTDGRLCGIVRRVKELHPDCAVTLSVGERSRESYAALRAAGAERYLLRHEAADRGLYERWHPAPLSYDNRMRCLRDLREEGFAVGMGFMVGAPGQTLQHVAWDLKAIEEFRPEMCGIGPFVPHHATEYADEPAGTVEFTCYLLSIIRLAQPNILLPATTALGTIHPQGRELGIQAGANVVMPNVGPVEVRDAYEIYDNKLNTGAESAEDLAGLAARMHAIGYELVVDRGDPR